WTHDYWSTTGSQRKSPKDAPFHHNRQPVLLAGPARGRTGPAAFQSVVVQDNEVEADCLPRIGTLKRHLVKRKSGLRLWCRPSCGITDERTSTITANSDCGPAV